MELHWLELLVSSQGSESANALWIYVKLEDGRLLWFFFIVKMVKMVKEMVKKIKREEIRLKFMEVLFREQETKE